MTNEDTSLMEEFLKNHDYELPQVGDIRQGVIVAITNQGVIVDLGLKRDGIVPSADLSKLDNEEREALHVNDDIAVYVTSTEAPDSLMVSIHLAKLNQDWIDAEALLNNGEIFEGEVIGYNKGGAIVPFGRLRGFIPASHLSDLHRGITDRQRQQKLAKLRGQKLPLKVIEVDRRRRRLVFSQRDAQKEWEEIRKQELINSLQEGDSLTGRVSGLRDFGIFVDLGGADGLVHISELAWHRIDHPREVVKVNDEIEVYVLKIDRSDQRISLSRKRLLTNPWTTVEERYDINQLVEGNITRIVDYGAFAELEPGIEGLLHVSQLSRGQVEKTSDVVNEGETHLLRIVSIEPDRQRIGLSLRAVSASEQIEWMSQKQAEETVEKEATVEASVEVEEEIAKVGDEETSALAESDLESEEPTAATGGEEVSENAVAETKDGEVAIEAETEDEKAAAEAVTETEDAEVATEAVAETEDEKAAAEAVTETEDAEVAAEAVAETEDEKAAAEAVTETEDAEVATEAVAETEDTEVATEAVAETEDEKAAAEAVAETEDEKAAAEAVTETEDAEVATEEQANGSAQNEEG
ncbi:MAG: S1 RNA-binding domain-containing protein [Chloroflexi bacterium]|nr:S1 RNA-binding domain-containing protein [Chloroflexota bacterium]